MKTFLSAAFAVTLSALFGAELQIGISVPSADHGWTGGVVYWANQAKKDIEAKYPDVKVLISTARDSAEQVDKIENMTVRRVNALVVLPHEPGPLTSICRKVVRRKIKLIVVDRNLLKPVQDLTVAGDNSGFGRVAAEVMARELNGKGNVVMMEGVPCQVNSDRVNAFRAEMAKHPGIRILESGASDWKTEKGLSLMENFLQKHPKLDAVWAGDDDVLLGALKAYRESGRKDVKVFIGGGGSKTIVKRILDGDPLVRLTVTYPPKMVYEGALEAVKMLKGTATAHPGKRMVVPAEVITRKNAKMFYFPDSAY